MAREDRTKSGRDLLFEALITQGCTAEKAARIAFLDEPDPEPKAPADKKAGSGRASWL